MKTIVARLCMIAFCLCSFSAWSIEKSKKPWPLKILIPTEANSWAINNSDKNSTMIEEGGIRNWTNPDCVIRTYFKISKPGKMALALVARNTNGNSKIEIRAGKFRKKVNLSGSDWDTVHAGTINFEKIGYQFIEIKGLSKNGTEFGEVKYLLVGGAATSEPFYFIKDDFYWGRRGPSVHLSYQLPEKNDKIEWFYNEITVPDGNDVEGSYFMANGFAQGYFGFQVNSPTERRVLFSIWSPYSTDNPSEIPSDQRVILLKKGEGVHTGEFGNEGSGGQSYYRYPWKAGNTYSFLLRAKPTGKGETDYTAWFLAPETGKWKLIASFRRPKTDTYLTRLHSFLENFNTQTGCFSRYALYTNQWVFTSEGKQTELTEAVFTADATARKNSRLDYSGSVSEDAFILKNCGFFDGTTPINSVFTRQKSRKAPSIDFSSLE